MSSNYSKKDIFKLFIDNYFKFIEFLKDNCNNNSSFLKFYKKNYLLKKANVKVFIRIWKSNINDKF